jgi:hypothetical protein
LETTFFQYGPENYRGLLENDDLILFFSEDGIARLKENNIWATDGTFSCVPEPFFQLYTISYIKNHHVFPCIFGLLKNKNQDTYVFMFKTIIDLVGILTPNIIKTDFEIAAINALKLTWPAARVSGCIFHLGQALDRKIKNLGLANTYATNFLFKKFTKALIALVYVKFERVLEQFEFLKLQDNFPTAIIPLYNYFYNNFVSPSARFKSSLWHLLNINDPEIPRTNNAIEGWHNTFSNTFGLCKSSFYILVKKLKDEEDVIRMRSIQSAELNHVFERKEKYIERETQLYNYLQSNVGNEVGVYLFLILLELLVIIKFDVLFLLFFMIIC